MPLEPEDQQHVTAAQGYGELGMFLDADAELDEIDPEVRHVPEVLAVRIHIYRALKKWELMQTVAKKMALYEVMKRKVKRTPRRSASQRHAWAEARAKDGCRRGIRKDATTTIRIIRRYRGSAA